jgi:4'-phosphopantetheinyl transferase
VKSAADEYLVAHVLVRTVLSRSARVAPHTWRFRNGKHGRPEIDGTPDVHGLRFNLSHTRGLVGCAVRWGSDIGIDLEAIEGGRPVPVHIADRSFAPPETSALRAAPPTERARLFYAFWTLKEAYLKARGLGLAVPLDWVTFALHPGLPIVVHFHPGLGDVADAWEFRLIDPTPCHLLALAVHRGTPQTRISIEEVDLLGLVTG